MKIIAWVAGIATFVLGAAYMIVSLNRWEWNRALFFGLIVVIAEIGLATGLVLRRLTRMEYSRTADRAVSDDSPRHSASGTGPVRLAQAIGRAEQRLHHVPRGRRCADLRAWHGSSTGSRRRHRRRSAKSGWRVPSRRSAIRPAACSSTTSPSSRKTYPVPTTSRSASSYGAAVTGFDHGAPARARRRRAGDRCRSRVIAYATPRCRRTSGSRGTRRSSWWSTGASKNAEGGQTLGEMVQAQVLACRLEVNSDVVGRIESEGDGRFRRGADAFDGRHQSPAVPRLPRRLGDRRVSARRHSTRGSRSEHGLNDRVHLGESFAAAPAERVRGLDESFGDGDPDDREQQAGDDVRRPMDAEHHSARGDEHRDHPHADRDRPPHPRRFV